MGGRPLKYVMNSTETFSRGLKCETTTLIFAQAAEYDLHVDQRNVTATYLNGDLEEEIYMVQREAFVNVE